MKILLRLGYASVLAFPLVSWSTLADDTDVLVTSSLDKACTFTSEIDSVVEVDPVPGETNAGRLGYTCNFVGATHLVLQLPDGTNLRNGSHTVLYDVFWGIPPNSATPGPYQNWPFPANLAFNWVTAGSPNVEIGGDFFIRLNTAPTIAGTYTSTITYTLSP